MNEFIEQFLAESHELVAQATDDLLALEEQPRNRERLDSLFRAFHTLKGAAGIVEFAAMEQALHAAEDVLAAVRSDAGQVTPALVGDCLICLDQVVQWLETMQVSGEPPSDAQASADAVIVRFRTTVDPVPPDLMRGPKPTSSATDPSGLARALLVAQLALLDGATPTPGTDASAARVAINVFRRIGRGADAASLEKAIAGPDGAVDAGAVRDILRGVLDSGDATTVEVAGRDPSEPATRRLRVDIERIDALVKLTGELTVAKNALAHAAELAAGGVDPAALAAHLKDQHAVLDRLVGELQRSVLNIRVLPLRQVFQRFPRLVREMVVSLGKPVQLVTEGDVTEADKAIVDDLFEPLLHVIRNAVDHGVEAADVRAAAGKPPSATIWLRAERRADRVVIEVEDDGAGIDLARVREVAADRGVAAPEVLAGLSEQELTELIFAPGFTTARETTSFSGRGVGMDAVRQAVERLGGRVTLDATLGQGTTVRFDLPFTVMISRVMTVAARDQMFAVPIEAVIESVRLPRDHVIPVGAGRAFVLRDRTIPLIDLGELLGDGPRTRGVDDALVVVVAADGRLGGLEVDRLGEPLDIMLKPLEGLLAGSPGIAGASLLGDGRVLIVLDLEELLR
jgi:two-component system chemotaxis sensor kinase CheA